MDQTKFGWTEETFLSLYITTHISSNLSTFFFTSKNFFLIVNMIKISEVQKKSISQNFKNSKPFKPSKYKKKRPNLDQKIS